MGRFLRHNSLFIVTLFILFLPVWAGQSVAGHRVYNAEQSAHQEPEVNYGAYLLSGHFIEATFENWESEFLQMGLYVLLTVWLKQRGSSESKPIDKKHPSDDDPERHSADSGAPWAVRRGGLALALYKHSLSGAFFILFALSFTAHAAGGAKEFSAEQQAHGGAAVTTREFMGTADFWFQSLQNWQSEFLAVAAIVILSVYLREKGSPESKPVASPHHETSGE